MEPLKEIFFTYFIIKKDIFKLCHEISAGSTDKQRLSDLKLNEKVNWVAKMRGGISGGTNFIGVCTKAYWKDMSHDEQQKIIIHELGHSLKMVTDGMGKLPAKTAYHYVGKGHQGNHCHQGITAKTTDYTNESDIQSAQCIMFGTICSASSFCSDCKKALRKLDLHNAIPS